MQRLLDITVATLMGVTLAALLFAWVAGQDMQLALLLRRFLGV